MTFFKTLGLLSALVLAFAYPSEELLAQKGKKKKKKFLYTQHFYSEQEILGTENRLEQLHRVLIGHFSNKEQAQVKGDNPLYAEQEIFSVPLWKDRIGEYWLYQCRVPADQPHKILGDAVGQVKRISRDSFTIVFYRLPERPEGYELEWTKENPFNYLSPKDLIYVDCDGMVLETKEKGVFDLVSSKLCYNPMSDKIQQVRRDGRFTPNSIQYFFGFYDAQGNQLFEYPKPEGLRFTRIEKTTPKYKNLVQ